METQYRDGGVTFALESCGWHPQGYYQKQQSAINLWSDYGVFGSSSRKEVGYRHTETIYNSTARQLYGAVVLLGTHSACTNSICDNNVVPVHGCLCLQLVDLCIDIFCSILMSFKVFVRTVNRPCHHAFVIATPCAGPNPVSSTCSETASQEISPSETPSTRHLAYKRSPEHPVFHRVPSNLIPQYPIPSEHHLTLPSTTGPYHELEQGQVPSRLGMQPSPCYQSSLLLLAHTQSENPILRNSQP